MNSRRLFTRLAPFIPKPETATTKEAKPHDSNIVGFEHEGEVLVIMFRDGSAYGYRGVPVKVFEDLKAAPSKGTYFHQRIKGKYPTQQLKFKESGVLSGSATISLPVEAGKHEDLQS